MANYAVRRATDADLDALINLRTTFLREQVVRGMQNGPKDIPAHVTETTPKLLNSRFAALFIAVPAAEPAEAAGYIWGQVKVRSGNYLYPAIGFVEEIMVVPEYRRMKLAQTLFAVLKDYFRGQNISWMELQAFVSSDVAQCFWQKQGFKPRLVLMDSPLQQCQETTDYE